MTMLPRFLECTADFIIFLKNVTAHVSNTGDGETGRSDVKSTGHRVDRPIDSSLGQSQPQNVFVISLTTIAPSHNIVNVVPSIGRQWSVDWA